EYLLPLDPLAVPARAAAAQFAAGDPGGRILVDSRFAADFALASGVDPSRLLTPFDDHFEQLVVAPPPGVRVIVVTSAAADVVAGNYPALRLFDTLPDATLIAQGGTAQTFVRAFRYSPITVPTADLSRPVVEPYAQAEERLLAALLDRAGDDLLLTRPDGWTY